MALRGRSLSWWRCCSCALSAPATVRFLSRRAPSCCLSHSRCPVLPVPSTRECVCLGLEDFPTADWLQWHGHQPGKPDWLETSRFMPFSMKDETQGEIYVAFNASHMLVVVGLREHLEYRWDPMVDTGKPAPYDFLTDELPNRDLTVQFSHFLNSNLYPMLSYSSIILVSCPDV